MVLRILGSGLMAPAVKLLTNPDFASFVISMQTGRVVRLRGPEREEPEWTAESPAPEISRPVIRREDGGMIAFHSTNSYEPDTEALLMEPLDWNLTDGKPAVLIYHSHATESYQKQPDESYEESADYRSLDPEHNMVSVGQVLARELEAGGIRVIHDRTLHDYPSYNDSYIHSRQSVQEILEANPTVRLVLDLHRDAADTPQGQMETFAQIGGVEMSRLMLVVGTDEGGRHHPNWRENLALALKLQVILEKENPGLCRKLGFRCSRFNQDLSPGALLIEIGAAGDSREQALEAARALGRAILAMAHGVQTEP